jgi:hypothetical protein
VKLKVFFVLNAVVLGASALTCLIFPDKVLSIYGVESNPASSFMGLYGALGSIAIVTVTWFARNVEDQKVQRAIILALMITYLIGIIISISGIISGVMTKGWPVVGIYLFFALGYAYFLFLKKEAAADAR